MTEAVRALPNVEIVEEEATDIPDGEVIVASGPLTSDALAENILRRTGSEGLHFYDAVAPIVSLDSVDMDSAFRASRYDKGTADYVNCPMTEEEYTAFWKELTTAREAAVDGDEEGSALFGELGGHIASYASAAEIFAGCLEAHGRATVDRNDEISAGFDR